MNLEKKRQHEKLTASKMIYIYCNYHHNTKKNTLCTKCQNLLDYVYEKSDNCPVMETKTFCSACDIHCYNYEKRNKIKKIMKYSGPRMLIHDPLVAMKHLLLTLKENLTRK